MRAPSPGRPFTRALLGVALAASLVSAFLSVSPASAATPQAPGTFAGKAFDICRAPDQAVMDAWWGTSPFGAIGVYISGNSRYCGEGYNPNLTPAWIQANATRGWRFLPLHVGYQSPCYANSPASRVQKKLMSRDVTTARAQATSDAGETIAALRRLGFGPGSASYLDIEAYQRSSSCDTALVEFIDAWTETLHASGFLSGVYSSGYSGIAVVNEAMMGARAGFTAPDHIWFAHTNDQATTEAGGPYLNASLFGHNRIHQYDNNSTKTYGGRTLTIDWNQVDVTATSVPGCNGAEVARIAAGQRKKLQRGKKGPAVSRLQAALAATGRNVAVTGKYNQRTEKAVRNYRKANGLKAGTGVTKKVWAALQAGKCT